MPKRGQVHTSPVTPIDVLDSKPLSPHRKNRRKKKRRGKRPICIRCCCCCCDCWSRLISITVLLPLVFITLILSVAGTMFTIMYVNSKASIDDLSENIVQQLSESIQGKIQDLFLSPQVLVNIIAIEASKHHLWIYNHTAVGDPSREKYEKTVQYLLLAAEQNSNVELLYFGNEYGDMISAGRTRDANGNFIHWSEESKHSYGTVYPVVPGETTLAEFCALTGATQNISTYMLYPNGTRVSETPYATQCFWDARLRSWYILAKAALGEIIFTEPYVFSDLALGITMAKSTFSSVDGSFLGVASVDFKMAGLNTYLSTIKVGKSGSVFLATKKGEFVAMNRLPFEDQQAKSVLDAAALQQAVDVEIDIVSDVAHEIIDRYSSFNSLFPTAAESRTDQSTVTFKAKVAGKGSYVNVANLPIHPNIDWLICIVLPEEDYLQQVWTSNMISIITTSAFVVFAVLVSFVLTCFISCPLRNLAKYINKVSRMELKKPKLKPIFYEVRTIQNRFAKMVRALQFFEKFVPASIVAKVMQAKADDAVGLQHAKNLTILFTDIISFSTFSERLAPEELLSVMSLAMDKVSSIIIEHDGIVDKYIGDAVMALYGAPKVNENPNHAKNAVLSAIAIHKALDEHRHIFAALGVEEGVRVRVGINTGQALVGCFGSTARLSWTALGDVVNEASRAESINSAFGTRTLFTGTTYEQCKDFICARFIDNVIVKGRNQTTSLFTPLNVRKHASSDDEQVEKLSLQLRDALDENDQNTVIKTVEEIRNYPGYENDMSLAKLKARAESEHFVGVQKFTVKSVDNTKQVDNTKLVNEESESNDKTDKTDKTGTSTNLSDDKMPSQLYEENQRWVAAESTMNASIGFEDEDNAPPPQVDDTSSSTSNDKSDEKE